MENINDINTPLEIYLKLSKKQSMKTEKATWKIIIVPCVSIVGS